MTLEETGVDETGINLYRQTKHLALSGNTKPRVVPGFSYQYSTIKLIELEAGVGIVYIASPSLTLPRDGLAW